MAALQEPLAPRSWVDIAKDFAIMIALSVAIIGGVVVLHQVIPPLG